MQSLSSRLMMRSAYRIEHIEKRENDNDKVENHKRSKMWETCFYHIFHLGLDCSHSKLIWLEQNILQFKFFLCAFEENIDDIFVHYLFLSLSVVLFLAKSFCDIKKSSNVLQSSITNSLKLRWQRFQNKNMNLSSENEMFYS